jgi:hypothetical protein
MVISSSQTFLDHDEMDRPDVTSIRDFLARSFLAEGYSAAAKQFFPLMSRLTDQLV